MTVTPRISEEGRRVREGASASKMNLLTPMGIGPTRRLSSSWSCSDLYLCKVPCFQSGIENTYDVAEPTYVSFHSRSVKRSVTRLNCPGRSRRA